MLYKKITTNAPFSANFLFNIVADVEKYPEFLPNCKNVKILSKDENTITAQMDISYKIKIKDINVSYISRIELMPDFFFIQITNADGTLFKTLDSSWKFFPSIDGSIVEYKISFALQNLLLNLTVGNALLSYTQKIIDAFIERAKFLKDNQKKVI